MNGPPDEGVAFYAALRKAEGALDDLEGASLDDSESARALEVVLDEVASCVSGLLDLHLDPGTTRPTEHVFDWLKDQRMLTAQAAQDLDILLEVAKEGRYGEELKRNTIKKAGKARTGFVTAVREMIRKS